MSLVVDVLDPALGDGQVGLGRREPFVAQELLQALDIRPVLHHVDGEGVPEDMGGDPAVLDAGLSAVL